LGFHGFRHAVKTMLRNAGVEERTNDILLGHKPAGTGGDYGSFTPRLLKDAIDRMDLPREVLAIPSRL
jgi:integrase